MHASIGGLVKLWQYTKLWYIKLIIHIRAAIAAIPQLVDVDLRGSIIDPYMIFDEGQHLYVKVGVKRVAAAAATTTDVVITTITTIRAAAAALHQPDLLNQPP